MHASRSIARGEPCATRLYQAAQWLAAAHIFARLRGAFRSGSADLLVPVTMFWRGFVPHHDAAAAERG